MLLDFSFGIIFGLLSFGTDTIKKIQKNTLLRLKFSDLGFFPETDLLVKNDSIFSNYNASLTNCIDGFRFGGFGTMMNFISDAHISTYISLFKLGRNATRINFVLACQTFCQHRCTLVEKQKGGSRML